MLQAEVLKGGDTLVALTQDHRILLLDLYGKVLDSVEERQFSPSSLLLAGDQASLATLSQDSIQGSITATLRIVSIDAAHGSLVLSQRSSSIEKILGLAENQAALSFDGSSMAYLETDQTLSAPQSSKAQLKPSNVLPRRPAKAARVMIAQLSSGEVRSIDLELPNRENQQVTLGFVSDTTLIVNSRPSGESWRVEVGEGFQISTLQSATAQDTKHAAHAYAKGIHLAADGSWLFVQDPLAAKHHYLGYSTFDPTYGSLSSDLSKVAWTSYKQISVDHLQSEGTPLQIDSAPNTPYFRAAFVDARRLVAADSLGGLYLLDGETGALLSTADAGGTLRDFEVDQDTGLIRGVRQVGGSWLAKVTEQGITGPWMVDDGGYLSGFLSAGGIWTLDSSNQYREYSVEAVRAGLPLEGEPANQRNLPVSTLAVDRQGRSYSVLRDNAAHWELSIEDVSHNKQSIATPRHSSYMVVSPDGSKIGIIGDRRDLLLVVDRKSGESLWATSFGAGLRELTWSKSSQELTAASAIGSVVFEAKTGKELSIRCGHFERRETAPPTTTHDARVPNLCER